MISKHLQVMCDAPYQRRLFFRGPIVTLLRKYHQKRELKVDGVGVQMPLGPIIGVIGTSGF